MDEKKRTEIIEKFSDILRKKGIKKSDLIDITGLNKNTITNLFTVNYSNATLPDLQTVYKILSALSSLGVHVNINDILGIPDPKDIEIEKFNINIKELIKCTNKIIIRQGGKPISYLSDTNSHNMKLFQYSFNCTSNISVYKNTCSIN